MTLDGFEVTGGNTSWRVWYRGEVVAHFATLTEAWLALKASRAAFRKVFS